MFNLATAFITKSQNFYRLYHSVVRLRGVPYESTKQDVITFLKDVKVKGGEQGIHLLRVPQDGRRHAGKLTGEAFIEFEDEKEHNNALNLNREYIGNRYIEVRTANLDEFEFATRKQEAKHTNETFVKLRGMPFSTSVFDVLKFLEGVQLKNGQESIKLITDPSGRSSGEAFVELSSEEEVEKALKKDREKIGHRYVEIFRSNGVSNFMRQRRARRSIGQEAENQLS